MWLSFLDEMDVFLIIIGELLNPWIFLLLGLNFVLIITKCEMSIDIIDIDNQFDYGLITPGQLLPS